MKKKKKKRGGGGGVEGRGGEGRGKRKGRMKNERDPRHLVYLLTPTLGDSSSKSARNVSRCVDAVKTGGKTGSVIGLRGYTVDKGQERFLAWDLNIYEL